ncbi:hypothetical protein OG21DRAFT_1528106 [Imleria badia]|nr:hypothetical protein OG21DRAFT_1528106 [Imleria badia]
MHVDTSTSYVINLGIDRPNITWEVQHMNAGKTDLKALWIILPSSSGDEGNENGFKQTMVFGDDIAHLMCMCRWVGVFHSWLTQCAKHILLEKFARGEIKVLFTTEAVGMGCDLPNIELVVQFMVPENLSIWMQWVGHAEKHEKKVLKNGDNTEVSTMYMKQVEDGLCAWLETKLCWRDVADHYFASSVKQKFCATQPQQALAATTVKLVLQHCPSLNLSLIALTHPRPRHSSLFSSLPAKVHTVMVNDQ